MFCTKCGKQLKDGTMYCDACGSPTSAHSQQQARADVVLQTSTSSSMPIEPVEKKRSAGKHVGIAAAIIALLALFGSLDFGGQTLEQYSSKHPDYLNTMVSRQFVNNNDFTYLHALGITETTYYCSGNQLTVQTAIPLIESNEIVRLLDTVGVDSYIGSLAQLGPDSPHAVFAQQIEVDTGVNGVVVLWQITDANGTCFFELKSDRNGSR